MRNYVDEVNFRLEKKTEKSVNGIEFILLLDLTSDFELDRYFNVRNRE